MTMRSRIRLRRGLVDLGAALLVLGLGTLAGADDLDASRVILTGTVVDEAGKAVAGADVSAKMWPKPVTVSSDPDGSFRLSLPSNPWGRIFTTVFARGGQGDLGVLVVSQDVSKLEPIRVVVKPPRTLEVRVADSSGQPVEGAEVHFLLSMHRVLGGRTDAMGRWAEKVPADSQVWSIYALKSKIGFDYALAEPARGSTDPPHPLPEVVALTLDGAGPPLRIKAVTSDGKPIPGVEVGPWLIQKPGREREMNGMADAFVKTDEAGVAAFDWIPARIEGKLSVVTSSKQYYLLDHAVWIPTDKLAGETTIELTPLERLSGRITTSDGQPASGATLTVQGQGAGSHTFRGETRSDAEGRFALKVYSEQAYILTARKGDLIAPYKSGVVVRAGKPVADVGLVVGRGTRVRGRVTVGADRTPAPEVSVEAVIDEGSIPADLKRKGDRSYHGMSMSFFEQTDKDGRFEFLLAPGKYTIRGPARVEPIKLTIAAEHPPSEIVYDLAMPRADSGWFSAIVVGTDGKPVAGAIVDGGYQSPTGWFHRISADAQGTIRIQRSLDPLVLHARTPDGSLAAVGRVDAEAAEARIVLKPTAAASGRLTDPEGKAIAGRKLNYGIRIHQGPSQTSPFSWHFGGATTTDERGGFRLAGLVVGETYEISTVEDEGRRIYTAQTKVNTTNPGPLALGDVTIDLVPPKPYVPPTPIQRAGASFAARKEKTAREKLEYVLTEAKREYTRPLLLIGSPKDPACVDLFRLFDERSGGEATEKAQPRVKLPSDLRWEFELSSLDASQADVAALARELGVPPGDGVPPMLAVLSEDGKLIATYALRLGEDNKLNSRALAEFLLEYKRPTRDASAMLSEALSSAKAGEKRVFLILSASWCGPCRMLSRFLAANRAELGRHFVFVKFDISRDDHIAEVRERYEGKDASNGVPWFVILDAAGRPLITSNSRDLSEGSDSRNVGFPSSKEGIAHFLKMLRETAPGLSDEGLATLRQGLEKTP